MTPQALLRLLLAACILACAHSAPAAEPPARVVIKGQRQPATVTIKGVRDPSDWVRAESRNLVVYSDSPVEQVVELIASIERLDQLLRIYFKPLLIGPAHAAKPTLIFRHDIRWEEEMETDLGSKATGAVTACTGGSQIFSFNHGPITKLNNTVLNDGNPTFGEVLSPFLYTKQFLLRHTDVRGPYWLYDGLAWYFSGVRFSDQQMLVGKAGGQAYELMKMIDDGKHAPRLNFAQVLDAQPIGNPRDPATLQEYIGRVFNLAHYMLSTEDRRRNMLRYLDLTNNGEHPAKAFADVYGLSGLGLDQTMWRYRQSKAKVLRVDVPDMLQPHIDITRLSRQEGRFVLPAATLAACPSPQRGRALLEQLRTNAAPLRTVDFAQMTLSRAEIDWGDPRRALPWLTALTTRDPEHAEGQYLLGLAHLTLAEQAPADQRADLLAAARAGLTQAAELQGRMPAVSYALHRLALLEQDTPDQQSVARAIVAWRYAHDVPAYARSAALAHAWLDDTAGAHNALNTLLRFDYSAEEVQWAQDWLARLRAGVPRDELVAAMRQEARKGAAYRLWLWR